MIPSIDPWLDKNIGPYFDKYLGPWIINQPLWHTYLLIGVFVILQILIIRGMIIRAVGVIKRAYKEVMEVRKAR